MPQAPTWNIPASRPSPIEDTTGRLIASLDALLTQHSGPLRPDYITDAGEGLWLQYVESPYICDLLYYDGDTDILLLSIDRPNNTVVPAGDIFKLAYGSWGGESSVASGTTVNLGAINAFKVEITGTTTITSFGSSADRMKVLRFSDALTLTHHATSLILPGGNNIVTAAGDVALVGSDSSGNWRVLSYTRANGTAISGSGGGVGANMLINGDFRVNQRAPATNADDSYAHDRWYALTQTSTIAISTILNQEDGTPYMARLTQSQASAQRMGYAQIVEMVNCRHTRGQAVALSARVRCSAATTLRYAVLEWTGTGDSVTSDVVNDWTNGTFAAGNFFLGSNLTVTATGSTALAANTLTDISLTGTCGSSLNNLIVFLWTDSTQAQNVTLDISKVKLEIGTAATSYVPDNYTELLDKCHRYCRLVRTSNMGRTESTTMIALPFGFEKPFRANPTGSLVGTIVVRDYTGAGNRTAVSPSINSFSVGVDGGYMELIASSWSPSNFAGAGSLGNFNSPAGGILIDAEL